MPRQKGTVTTDAYPDRKYQGVIYEADRSKATVQVKVKVLNPDSYLRRDMNATVAFYNDLPAATETSNGKAPVVVPEGVVQNGNVFLVFNGRA